MMKDKLYVSPFCLEDDEEDEESEDSEEGLEDEYGDWNEDSE